MSENTQNPSEVPYDAQKDSDADPSMLNPREQGAQDGSATEDQDADPGSMNPRETE